MHLLDPTLQPDCLQALVEGLHRHSQGELIFLPGAYILHTHTDQGDSYKFVSPQALRSAFVHEPIDSGWLHPQVCRWGIGSKGEWFVWIQPAGIQEITLEIGSSLQVLKIPLPTLIMLLHGQDHYIWASQNKRFDPSAEAFRCPLPNVYDPGQICWGGNQPLKATSTTVERLWQLFIGSPFSNHLTQNRSRRHKKDVLEMLLFLSGKRTYPVKDLVPLRTDIDALLQRTLAGDRRY